MSAERRTPALLAHRDVMAIRGLPHTLRQRKMTQAAEAIENIVSSYDALGDFVVVQETPLIAAAVAGVAPMEQTPARRRRWRRSAA